MDGLVAIARCRGSFLFRVWGRSRCSAQALSFESKNLPIKHIPGPEGVRGRNSDNQMIKEKLGWAPSIPVAEGLKKTYFWIKAQVEKDKAAGLDITKLGTSEIVVQTTDDLDELAAQGLAGKC